MYWVSNKYKKAPLLEPLKVKLKEINGSFLRQGRQSRISGVPMAAMLRPVKSYLFTEIVC
jgi:hypothetical protein